jgi:hypothetical protein
MAVSCDGNPNVQARVCRKLQQKPLDDSTHWSVCKLAYELGMSKSTVQRILLQVRLQPHRPERYIANNAPKLEFKPADITWTVPATAPALCGVLCR